MTEKLPYLTDEDIRREMSAYRRYKHIQELNECKRRGIEYVDDFGNSYAPPMYQRVKLSLEELDRRHLFRPKVKNDKYRKKIDSRCEMEKQASVDPCVWGRRDVFSENPMTLLELNEVRRKYGSPVVSYEENEKARIKIESLSEVVRQDKSAEIIERNGKEYRYFGNTIQNHGLIPSKGFFLNWDTGDVYELI